MMEGIVGVGENVGVCFVPHEAYQQVSLIHSATRYANVRAELARSEYCDLRVIVHYLFSPKPCMTHPPKKLFDKLFT